MSDVRIFRRSFAGGVVTPEFFGQIADVKFQTGLSKCLNAIVLPHGPVANRGGTKFVRACKYNDRETIVLPFTFDTSPPVQTYAIEVGDEYMRFHTNGATLAPGTVSAYNGGTAYVVGDIVSSGGTNYYCIQDTTGNAPPNATYWYAMPDGILEIPTGYSEDDLQDIHFVQSNDVLTLTHPNYPPAELRRFIPSANTPYSFKVEDIQFASELSAPANVTATATTGSGSTTYSYKVTAVGEDGIEESLPSTADDCTNDLLTTGNENTITWDAVTGAVRYNVYLQDNGLYGFIGQTDDTSFVDSNIAADISQTPPIEDLPFTGAGNYPAEVTYFEQRRLFAGTDNLRQNLWMSRVATESNLSYSIPLRDEDAIRFRIAAREANRIRHAVPVADLLLLTSSAEFRITAINTDAVTPSSISIKPQSYVGASNVRPAMVNNNVIFEAARGGHWREIGYDDNAGGYVTGDLSLRAPHLFDNYTTKVMAYAKAPYPIIWGVSSNGKLVGFTYVPEQNIGAFHEHDTATSAGQSHFKSLCVVAEDEADVWYAVVEREINGSIVKYIERNGGREFTTSEDAYFVDCGATLDNPINITNVTRANPGVVTTDTAHGLSNGDRVDIRDVVGMTELIGQGYLRYKAANVTSTTFELQTDEDTPQDVDTSGYTAYKSGGTVRATVDSLSSGLDHLEGEIVSVLANGAVEAQKTVTGGVIELDNPASIVQVGLPIMTDIETLPVAFDGDGAFGQGMQKSLSRAWLRVFKSGGIFAGPSFDQLTEYKQRTSENYGMPPELKSGELDSLTLSNEWGADGKLAIRQADPLPLTLVSVTLEMTLGG